MAKQPKAPKEAVRPEVWDGRQSTDSDNYSEINPQTKSAWSSVQHRQKSGSINAEAIAKIVKSTVEALTGKEGEDLVAGSK
jgi:hypothetical protein